MTVVAKRDLILVKGMTLLETLVAMFMLVMFFGVFVAVLEVTSRFVGEVENEFSTPKGVLIDHQEIQLELDELVEVLTQPGISKNRLDGQVSGAKQIAFDVGTDPDQACTPAGSNPLIYWGLPGPSLSFPDGYRICLWRGGSALAEASLSDLSKDASNANPGIYVLQALPVQADAARLPTRRVFCRPRPFC